MIKNIITTVFVLTSLAAGALAQERTTYTTKVSFEKNGRMLSQPRIRQAEATKGTVEVELEKDKRVEVQLVPGASGKVAITLKYKQKAAKFELPTDETSTIEFMVDGIRIRNGQGKIVREEKEKGFPTKELKGVMISVECRKDEDLSWFRHSHFE